MAEPNLRKGSTDPAVRDLPLNAATQLPMWASTVLTGLRLQEPFVQKRCPCLFSYDAVQSNSRSAGSAGQTLPWTGQTRHPRSRLESPPVG